MGKKSIKKQRQAKARIKGLPKLTPPVRNQQTRSQRTLPMRIRTEI